MSERYFYVDDLDGRGYFHIPKAFYINSEYERLSSFAKITWAILVDLIVDAYDSGWICEKTKRIYLINPETLVNEIFQYEASYNSTKVFNELVEHELLEVEHNNGKFPKRYFIRKPVQDLNGRNYHDYLKMKRQYMTNVVKNKEVYDKNKNIEKDKQAISVIESYFEYADLKQLTDHNKLVLYENLDKIEWLTKNNLFSLSLMITLKTNYSLSADDFSHLLQKAFSLYRYDENNSLHFTSFFEQIINNQALINNKEKLIWEIDQKLIALPNELKKFVYDEMRKYEHKFPRRYEQIIHNLRHINTVYEEFEDLPIDVFQKAFRRLFSDYEIHHLGMFFKKGIQFILNEGKTKEKKVSEKENNAENWLEQLFSNVSDDENDDQDNHEYEKRKEALSKKLKNLNKGD